jgi:hypothetical protein
MRENGLLAPHRVAWLVARHGYRTPAQCEPINAGLIRTLRPI